MCVRAGMGGRDELLGGVCHTNASSSIEMLLNYSVPILPPGGAAL